MNEWQTSRDFQEDSHLNLTGFEPLKSEGGEKVLVGMDDRIQGKLLYKPRGELAATNPFSEEDDRLPIYDERRRSLVSSVKKVAWGTEKHPAQ